MLTSLTAAMPFWAAACLCATSTLNVTANSVELLVGQSVSARHAQCNTTSNLQAVHWSAEIKAKAAGKAAITAALLLGCSISLCLSRFATTSEWHLTTQSAVSAAGGEFGWPNSSQSS